MPVVDLRAPMEASLVPSSTRANCFSSGSGLNKWVNQPVYSRPSSSFASTRRNCQSLCVLTRPHFCKANMLKVSCSSKREVPYLEARCMDEVYDSLAERLVPNSAVSANPNFKHIVGLAGPPGSGKSTLSSEVVRRINKLWPQKASSFNEQVAEPDIAVVLPMDGFHLYRHQLDAMKDPKEAHARRGAPWTFDPAKLLECLKTLRSQGYVCAPSFDHGVGDPVEDDICVGLQHKVVIVEGNYLLLPDGMWSEISTLFDEKWFIDVDLDTSMQRVLKRHIQTGKSSDEAQWRIDYNDRPNAEMIMMSKNHADLIIRSIDFSS